jgi:predicted permease
MAITDITQERGQIKKMPDWKAELTERLSALRIAPEREFEIIEELAEHLEERYQELLLKGVPPVEAERQTRGELSEHEMLARELGRIERRETPLPNTSSHFVSDVWQDGRHAMRLLRKSPGFTLVTVMTLALGIGANTAIFTFVNALMLRTLPVQEPHDLVLFKVSGPYVPAPASYNFSYPLYEMFANQSHSFAGIIAANNVGRARFIVNDQANGGTESVQQQRVSGNFFSVLGVSAIKGRTLTESDDSPSNTQPAAVISYDYWQRRFGLDPNIVGRSVTINNTVLTIVGVTPPEFFGFDVAAKPELWWSLKTIPDPNLQRTGSWWLRVIGRLRPDVSAAQAQAEVDAIFRRQIDDEATNTNWTSSEQRRNHFERHAVLEAGATGYTGLRRQFRQPLFVLMVAVGLVLLIACVNVANLLLARAVTRRKEIAIRIALGASRFRLLRQLLTESIFLSVIGGIAGLIVARICVRVLTTYLPEQSQSALDVAVDTRVLLFTLSVSVLTGLLFGLTPAWQTMRQSLTTALKDQTGTSAGPSRLAVNKLLIVAQVSLSLFLLVGGGLFLRTLRNLRTLDVGMNYKNIIQFSLDTGDAYSPKQRSDFYKRVLERLESLPGAHSATLSYFSLLGGDSISYNITASGFSPPPDESTECDVMAVGPRFFETMKMPILSGRDFGPQDERPVPAAPGDSKPTAEVQPLSAVINQSMAHFFYGDQEPIGKRFSIKGTKQELEVVGVTQDSKYEDLREQTPRIYYVYYFQQPQRTSVVFQLRTDTQASDYGGSIQRLVSELDRKVQVVGIKTMADVVDQSLLRERFMAQTATAFSLVALMLACIGLYGVMSNAVTRRTNEIGIRMALGAESRDVVKLVMREVSWLIGVGAAIGLLAAFATMRLVSNLLFGIRASDPLTIAFATLLLILVAALAGYFPARRASRVDPLIALRAE